jgi:hypothetical protein
MRESALLVFPVCASWYGGAGMVCPVCTSNADTPFQR